MIEFNKPLYDEKETEYVQKALSGHDYIYDVKDILKQHFMQDNIYLMSSASSAIEMAFLCMDLPKDSEVIIPSFNYPSIGNTILKFGLKPVFADVSKQSTVIDLDQIKALVTDKTRCIVPVHYGGISLDMDELIEFADKNNIYVFEDAALSYLGEYKGRKLGTIGNMGIISFHETKNISCGSGGLLIINDDKLNINASNIYNNGTNREEFFQGNAKMYSWKTIGINGTMSNTSAAILFAQLEKTEQIKSIRNNIYKLYLNELGPYAKRGYFSLPNENDFNKNNSHVFYLMFPNIQLREKIRLSLKDKSIEAHTHYVPLHLSYMGKTLGCKKGDLPYTEEIFENQLRLPLHNCMSIYDAQLVINAILETL